MATDPAEITQPSPAAASSSLAGLHIMITNLRLVGDHPTLVPMLLGPYLDPLDFASMPADPLLIEAATRYAMHATGSQQIAMARYAVTAASRLYPAGHPTAVTATDTLARVLHAIGDLDQAISLLGALIWEYTALRMPAQAMACHSRLADCLHREGYCREALATIRPAWGLWLRRPDTHGGVPTGRDLLYTYIRLLNGCGLHADLAIVLHQAGNSPLAGHINADSLSTDPAIIARHQPICVEQTAQGEQGHYESSPFW